MPGGADVYLLKRVLMIWGDEPAIQVLRHCAAALPPDGKVLVVEMVMPSGNEPSPARGSDVLMLLANQGDASAPGRIPRAVRSGRAAPRQVVPTASPNSILEGVPRVAGSYSEVALYAPAGLMAGARVRVRT